MSIFDPANCQWASMPFVTKPNHGVFDSGSEIGYAQGVMKCKCGRTEWNPPHPGIAHPYYFDGALFNCIKDLQSFFGLPVNGYIDQATWGIIDYLAVYT